MKLFCDNKRVLMKFISNAYHSIDFPGLSRILGQKPQFRVRNLDGEPAISRHLFGCLPGLSRLSSFLIW